jgi:hypothetical protein
MVEEAAHAPASAPTGRAAVKSEGMTAVMLVAMAVPATAMMVMMSSKHVFSTPFRYIELTDISKPFAIKSYFRYI